MTARTAAQAPVVCHYAADPARRPHCTLTAEVRPPAAAAQRGLT